MQIFSSTAHLYLALCIARAFAALVLCTALTVENAAAGDALYGYTDDDGVVHFSDVADDPRYQLMIGQPAADARPTRDSANAQKQPYRTEIAAAAAAHGVDAALISAVITTESAGDPSALSRKGALGLMQLMPDTAQRYGVRDRKDPRQNIEGGTRYLKDLMQKFDGDLKLALAAYNAGEQTVARYGNRIPPLAETVDYVARVLERYKSYAVK